MQRAHSKMDNQHLSILATFDDMRRWESVLNDGAAEVEFLRFAQSQDEKRIQWLTAVQEAQRVQRELDSSLQNVAGLETKLYHARRLLESAQRAKCESDKAREALERKIHQAHDLLYTENINEATRTKFAFLNGGTLGGPNHTQNNYHHNDNTNASHQRQSNAKPSTRRSYKHTDVYGNDVNSTGSFVCDMSITRSEDDFLDDVDVQTGIGSNGGGGGAGGRMRKHQSSFVGDANASFVGPKRSRLSVDGNGKTTAMPSRRSNALNKSRTTSTDQHHQHHHTEHVDYVLNGNEKIVASTRVSIPHGNGPITAESVIEAIPEPQQQQRSQTTTTKSKRAPPVPPTAPPQQEMMFDTMPATPNKRTTTTATTASATPYSAYPSLTPRQHSFAMRTFLKSDTCLHCQKRIKFGSSALKCRECRICIHADCRPQMTLACVPVSAMAGPLTPKGGAVGVVGDYAPSMRPQVPGLVVHCVNEIESRGFGEVGIYRVNGSEKDVKGLKERFLRGKSVPPLQGVDVHVLCGCVKDFLRNLREPLVPTSLWPDFSNAVQSSCRATAAKEIYRALDRMPTANRDTLAFLMQHFLRIASVESVKMPASNLARVFGPTIVGYSSAEPDQHAILTETHIQVSVMEQLLEIPADYWCRFLTISSDGGMDTDTCGGGGDRYTDSNAEITNHYFGTPSMRKTPGRKNKFYATPPYSTIIKPIK